MRKLSLTLIFFKLFILLSLIGLFILKENKTIFEKWLLIITIVLSLITLKNPFSYIGHLLILILGSIDLYIVFREKINELENRNDNFEKNFMILFTAIFDDYKIMIDACIAIIKELKYILIDIIIITVEFIGLVLSIVFSYNKKQKSNIKDSKIKGSKNKSENKDTLKSDKNKKLKKE